MAGPNRSLDATDPPWLADFLATALSSHLPVLLRGESGSGKTFLARRIHEEGARKGKPLLELDCAGAPSAELESELFGHEVGALTGASARRRGLIEAADGGSVLLEEVGALELLVQPKLLRAIESGRFRRVGGTSELTGNVRVLATTTKELGREVESGRFREDLYYRLGVLELALPPLRERSAELPALVRAHLVAAGRRLGRPKLALAPGAIDVLAGYDWPGNLRQLEHVLERAAVGGPDAITAERVQSVLPPRRMARGSERVAPLGGRERARLLYLLSSLGYNMRQVAKQLGVSRTTLYQRVRELGIDIQAGRVAGRSPGAAVGEGDEGDEPEDAPTN